MQRYSKLLLLVFIFILAGCHSANWSDDNGKEKSQVYIRGKAPEAIGPHEKLAAKFPQFYFIEGKTERKQVALTFDDGPSHYSELIAARLAKHNIKATFFMVGNVMQQSPDIVKRLYMDGHVIANHSWDHANAKIYVNLSDYWQQQVAKQMAISEQIIGKRSALFRPPYGSISEQQVAMLKNNHIRSIIWSIDTQDWDEQNTTHSDIANTSNTYRHPEAIILMHDGGGNRQATLAALDDIINDYLQAGYEFVTVDQLLDIPAYF